MTTKAQDISAAARALGRRGAAASAKVRSPAKAAASRTNGRRGGRPLTDTTIAERIGARHAGEALAAGAPAGPHSGEIGKSDWSDVECALGRTIYGYAGEGAALARDYIRGWNRVMRAEKKS